MSVELPRVGFIGAGQMATALARGWIKTGMIQAAACRAVDPIADARQSFQKETQIPVSEQLVDVIDHCDVLLLAVKPQNMGELLQQLHGRIKAKHLLVSIAAGVTLHQLADDLGTTHRIIRVMPNTPAVVHACAAAYTANELATAADVALVDRLLNSVGVAMPVSERLLDAVTGLSGSGPAYVFTIIEALSDGGLAAGLPRSVASQLAAQTVFGAAKMVLESGTHPAVLKEQVASPGGTTIAGLQVLEHAGLRSALIEAVVAATRRATELGKATHG